MAQETTTKRGPGRPPGSKNKNKNSNSSANKSSKSSSDKTSLARPVTKQDRIAEMQKEYEKDKRTVDIIWSITLFAIGIFLLFTVIFNSTGAFGSAVHSVCIGLFGDIAYALPFAVLIFAGLLVAGKLQHIGIRTTICGFMIIINMCLLNSYRFIDETNLAYGFGDIAQFYSDSVDGSSGGVFGMEIGSILVKYFGKPGLLIIAIAVLLICIVLVANTPISRFFDNLAKKWEERKILKEMEEAEADKVDAVVAASASKNRTHPEYDDTLIISDEEENKSFWKSIRKAIGGNEEVNSVPAREKTVLPDEDIKPAIVEKVNIRRPVTTDMPASDSSFSERNSEFESSNHDALMAELDSIPEQKDDSVMQMMNRNTLFGKLAQRITGKNKGMSENEDNEDYGYQGRRAMGIDAPSKSYSYDSGKQKKLGLGNPDDVGNSGYYGLDGHYIAGKSRGKGLGESGSFSESGATGLGSAKSEAASSVGAAAGFGIAASADAVSGAGASDAMATRPSTRTRKASRNNTSNTGALSAGNAAIAAGTIANAVKNSGKDVNSNSDLTQNSAEDEALANSFSSETNDSSYVFPPITLLRQGSGGTQLISDYQLEEKADQLEKTLNDFGVDAKVINVTQGASVTRYEVQPATGVKVSHITRLSDDIALNMRAKSIRMEAPIPGKAAVGIEVENDKPSPVLVRELIDSKEFRNAKSKISFVVGKDISGNNIVANLKDMPHLLIAGATGSGKSVCINTIITSFLYKAKPSELKLIMIDPKVVELSNYNGIPHMLTPVVTDPKKAARALAIAVQEMDKRYELFAQNNVKDLESFNEKMRADHRFADVKPQVVIIIDELADLMMAAPSDVESSICRLAQKARAAGMHLIVATQRPSVDVVTGLIKANIPSRIAFSVASQIDSRTILDMAGAEKLLGKGDMLFSPVGSNKPYRVQGPFITETETENIINFVKQEGGAPEYDEEIKSGIESNDKKGSAEPQDELTEDAIAFILKSKQASVSMLQRRFRIGYNRAARIIDEIEEKGIIGPSDGARPRQVLMTEDEYYGSGESFDETDETEDTANIVTGEINTESQNEANTIESTPEDSADDETSSAIDASTVNANSAIEYFNSLPESVRRQILDSDHHFDD